MAKTIRVTNLFTDREVTYERVDAFREDAKRYYDISVAGLIDLLADAYAEGRPTATYEWMLGVRVDKAA